MSFVDQIHEEIQSVSVFESVCEFLGTQPAYYSCPAELANDFSLKEISIALSQIQSPEDADTEACSIRS